jgi:hypothetical protein
MKVIGEQCPGIHDKGTILAEIGYPRKEILPISISPVDGGPLDPATDQVMKGPWRIKPSVAWHEDTLRKEVRPRQVLLEPT